MVPNSADSTYPVVDLFAGPGGLGEGFASVGTTGLENTPPPRFFVAVSIEKDRWAHKTLFLRHFYRTFPYGRAPEAYYQYLSDELPLSDLLVNHPEAATQAERSALQITLGTASHAAVQKLIEERLQGQHWWVLVGGPPCQAYSVAGRSRMKHLPGFDADERHTLYREYLKIIADHRPPVFLMENVKGLLSATHRGESIMAKILSDLSQPSNALAHSGSPVCHYTLHALARESRDLFGNPNPRSFVVKAERYGVPQTRHRVFILGVRGDLKTRPELLKPHSPPTVAQTIGHLPPIRSGVTGSVRTRNGWTRAIEGLADIDTSGSPCSDEIQNLAQTIGCRAPASTHSCFRADTYSPDMGHETLQFMHDPRLSTITGHAARAHMPSDLRRYAFAATYAEHVGKNPKLQDFPNALLPAHSNIGGTTLPFPDRFKVQRSNRVASTITAHIAKDGNYYIHYDPVQCRSLSVREAARLQTFPDNYHFDGPRTEQYRQIGNAVPPYLAMQIGELVADILDKAKSETT